jgi:hypothetical protein
MIILRIRLCSLKILLKREPEAAQQTVEKKPRKARKNAKQSSTGMLVYQGRTKEDIMVIAKITSLGLINCRTIPVMKLPLEPFSSRIFEGRRVFRARYNISAAPSIFMGN